MATVRLQLRPGAPAETLEVVAVGSFTVRLRRSDGIVIQVKRKRVEQQLAEALKPPKVRFTEIATPMGGQPGRKKRRPKS